MNEGLLELAAHDEAAARARHDLAHLPSQPALDDAVATLGALVAEKRDLDALFAPLAARAAELERDAAAAGARAGVIAERLRAATGAGRDLAAMESERTHLESRVALLEDDQLAVLEELEPLEAAAASLRARAEDAIAHREAATTALTSERSHAEATGAELAAARPALCAVVDPALLARYEQVAARTGAGGAARLVDGRCGGCHVAVPAAVADRLVHGADPDVVAVCDECGRLLVR